MSPREQDGEHGSSEQRPFHRTFHDEQSQDEEHEHERTHIHRTARSRLLTPILSDLLIGLHILWVCFLHGLLVVGHRYTCSTLYIWHEEGPGLIDTVAPLGDVVAVKTT